MLPLIKYFSLLWLFLFIVIFFSSCSKNNEGESHEADRLCTSAQSYVEQKKYQKAEEALNRAIEINIEQRRDSALGANYLLLANIRRFLGLYDSVDSHFTSALERVRFIANRDIELKIKLASAEFHYALGDYSTAKKFASEVTTSGRLFGCWEAVETALMIEAKASHQIKKYDNEIRILSELLVRAEQIDDTQSKINIYRLFVSAYASADRLSEAREIFSKWKTLANATGDNQSLALAYKTWGNIKAKFNEPESAFTAYSVALSHMDKQTDKKLQVDILSSLGYLAYNSRQYDDAHRYFYDALNAAKGTSNVLQEQLLQLILTTCDWKIGGSKNSSLTTELLERCRSIQTASKEVGFRIGEAAALYLHAKMIEPNDTSNNRFRFYEQALRLFRQTYEPFEDESMEANIIKSFFAGERSDWYEPLLKHYCNRGQTKEAFDLSQEKNLQDIKRYFSQLTINTTNASTNKLIEILQWKHKELRLLERDIIKEISKCKDADFERIQLLDKILPERMSETTSMMIELASRNANLRWLFESRPARLRQIQDSLKENSSIIEFIPTSDMLFGLVIKKDTVLISKIAVDRHRLLSSIEEYKRLIGDSRLSDNITQSTEILKINRINELSSMLGKILIEPVLPLIDKATTLYLVPPNEFGWLPFHTLQLRGMPLIEQWNISYLPTAAALLFFKKTETSIQNVTCIGFSGYTNWDVEYELRDVRSFYDSTRMLFNEDAIIKNLKNGSYDLLHFAVQFTLDVDVPNNSGFIFSDGRTAYGMNEVQLGDVFQIKTHQALVVSNITPTAGEFYRYAPLAFLSMGTPTIIATMWQGDRKAKRYFGEVFYTSLKNGIPTSQAYHNAVNALIKKEEYSRQHRWGLFYRFGK
ncbi:MAG: CHAT domain-containing protein [Bacteroidota bacterium]|nr:CHAT domain-containing protein [Bacteroidota bacterium]